MRSRTLIFLVFGVVILLFFLHRYYLAAPRGLEPRWVMDLSSQHQALARAKLHRDG